MAVVCGPSRESCARKRLGSVGGGLGIGEAQEFLLLIVKIFDQTAEAARVVTVEEFASGVGEGFAEAIDDTEEGVGGFGRDVAIGDEGEEAGEHEGEAGAGNGVVRDGFGEKTGDALIGALLAELGSVRRTIAFTCGGAGQAAAAAVGVSEGAHAGAVFGGDSWHLVDLAKNECEKKKPRQEMPRA